MPLPTIPDRFRPWIQLIIVILGAFLGTTGATQVSGCGKGPPPEPQNPDKPPPVGKRDPWNAIGKLTFDGGYCSGTVIGPRMEDGRWIVVTAAHCNSRPGTSATFVQRSGISRRVHCVAVNRAADIAIYHTEANQGEMSYTDLAGWTPPPDTKVFHGGFGRHLPGNREEGRVISLPNADGQVQYELSVSPGDSGGGICMDADGALLSPVCCTTRLDGPGRVWGGSPEMIKRMIVTPTEYIDLPPIPMPKVDAAGNPIIPKEMPPPKKD